MTLSKDSAKRLEAIKLEIECLRDEAYDEGREDGYQDGYESGLEEGRG